MFLFEYPSKAKRNKMRDPEKRNKIKPVHGPIQTITWQGGEGGEGMEGTRGGRGGEPKMVCDALKGTLGWSGRALRKFWETPDQPPLRPLRYNYHYHYHYH